MIDELDNSENTVNTTSYTNVNNGDVALMELDQFNPLYYNNNTQTNSANTSQYP